MTTVVLAQSALLLIVGTDFALVMVRMVVVAAKVFQTKFLCGNTALGEMVVRGFFGMAALRVTARLIVERVCLVSLLALTVVLTPAVITAVTKH